MKYYILGTKNTFLCWRSHLEGWQGGTWPAPRVLMNPSATLLTSNRAKPVKSLPFCSAGWSPLCTLLHVDFGVQLCTSTSSTTCRHLAGMVVLGGWLDLMILKVFSNWWFYVPRHDIEAVMQLSFAFSPLPEQLLPALVQRTTSCWNAHWDMASF